MSIICQNCKTENSDNSKFCQNCGKELKGVKNEVKNDKKPIAEITSWWNKQTKGGQTAIGLSVCCLGILLIIG